MDAEKPDNSALEEENINENLSIPESDIGKAYTSPSWDLSVEDLEKVDTKNPNVEEIIETFDFRSVSVIEEWENGALLIAFQSSGGVYKPLNNSLYYIPASAQGISDWIGSPLIGDSGRRTQCFAELQVRTGYSESKNETMVPLSIALEGKEAVTTYLFAVEEWDHDHIAKELEESTPVVRQHITNFVKKNEDED